MNLNHAAVANHANAKAGYRRMPRTAAPILSLMEDRVLKQLSYWQEEYEEAMRDADSRQWAYRWLPTTKKFSEYFRFPHGKMLELLNRLESYGYLHKERQLSAGLYGNGYDGALHSSVLLTKIGREVASCL